MGLLAALLCIVGAALFWSSRNSAAALKGDPARITAMDIVVYYSGEVGEDPGPITYSDILDGEDFAQLVAHTSFWRLPRETVHRGQYSGDQPHCMLRIRCREEHYYWYLTPDGKRLDIDGENILVSGDLQERILALNLGPDPAGQRV